jgi:hypothetical protein
LTIVITITPLSAGNSLSHLPKINFISEAIFDRSESEIQMPLIITPDGM